MMSTFNPKDRPWATTPKPERRLKGFTLIEVLVVVAIIALLVSILLPSLNKARAQARWVTCMSNMRQLATAAITYSVEGKGRLPGMRGDDEADWLGGSNSAGAKNGRQVLDGTLFKYMGKQSEAYLCPEDKVHVSERKLDPDDLPYSITGNLLVAGAKTEMLSGAHYRQSSNRLDPKNYSKTEHTTDMRPFEGVPVFVEEDTRWHLTDVNDSGWCNDDQVAMQHLRRWDDVGWGNVTYADGHAGKVSLMHENSRWSNPRRPGEPVFRATSMCIRTRGGKWVSGDSWKGGGMYGFMDDAPPASSVGVKHR